MIAILNDGKTLSFPQSIPPLKEEEEENVMKKMKCVVRYGDGDGQLR